MADNNFTSLPEHYEHHFGAIARGWTDDKRVHGIQVVSFENQPEQGVKTFATLGLSRHVIDLDGVRQIRQEILISANDAFSGDAVAGLLLSLAESVVERGKALLRGQVIGPGTPVIVGATLTSIYVTNPSPFDKSLTEIIAELPPTVFAYLVPITSSEGSLVRDQGWKWFEDQLERQNPDIWDLARREEVTLSA